MEREIKTYHVHPPIPAREFDWAAWVDGCEESGPTGYGRTEQTAIDDLLQKLNEIEQEKAHTSDCRVWVGETCDCLTAKDATDLLDKYGEMN